MLNYDDPKRSYKTLLHLMDRCIQKQREQKNLQQTQVGLQQMIQGKDMMTALPAKTIEVVLAVPAFKEPSKPKNEEAAPVLPLPPLISTPKPDRAVPRNSRHCAVRLGSADKGGKSQWGGWEG